MVATSRDGPVHEYKSGSPYKLCQGKADETRARRDNELAPDRPLEDACHGFATDHGMEGNSHDAGNTGQGGDSPVGMFFGNPGCGAGQGMQLPCVFIPLYLFF